MELKIKKADFRYSSDLLKLYKNVAKISDGIIRNENEIDQIFISEILDNSVKNGLILVGLIDETLVGEIHAYTPKIFAFQHILTNLTIVVTPSHQGKGIGRKLFEKFLEYVKTDFVHILRIELYTREQNERNVNPHYSYKSKAN